MTTPRPFVILSDSRSGTSFLSETLNTHPQIVCHGEVFHKSPAHHLKGDWRGLDLERILAMREESWSNYLAWIFDQPGAAAVGFKMWQTHNPEACDALLTDERVLKIIYERTNVLARYSSSRLVRATGLYNLGVKGKRSEKLETMVTFHRPEFEAYIARHRQIFATYRERAAGPVLELTYDALRTDGFRPVLGFLGVEDVPLQAQKQKLYGSDILARFEPLERAEVLAVLEKLGHPEWATE